MYTVIKTLEVAGAHRLMLDYESPCQRLHGHNWKIKVYCRAEHLNKNGMVVDFKQIKEAIHGRLDHQYLNDIVPFNPTAENIARWITEQIPECYRAEVQESEGNLAIYETGGEVYAGLQD